MNAHRNKIKQLSLWTICVLGLTLLCYLANVILGPLNQDEGWYLYAARLMMEGAIPHKDFFFTQGVLMPAIYACFGWAWSCAGVLGGRLLTVLFALFALGIARSTLNRVLKPDLRPFATLSLLAFLGINLWYTYFTTLPKTYSLCTLGLAGAFWALTWVQSENRLQGKCFASLAGALLAALVDIRFSMGILLPVVAIWLLINRDKIATAAWFWFSLSASSTLLILFLPEWCLWREGFLEALHFHAARESMGVVGIIGCVARVLRFNPILCLTTLLVGWGWLSRRFELQKDEVRSVSFPQLWVFSAVALMSAHLIAPVPYDDYLVPAMLPLAMAMACFIYQFPLNAQEQLWIAKGLVLGAMALSLCASPIAQDWFVAGQDRFWVQMKQTPDLVQLRNVARQIRGFAEALGEDTLWTQDTYLAVEAGLHVPAGMEMGPFSKPRPLDATPRIAAWSGYTYALSFPSLTPNLERDAKIEALRAVYGRTLLMEPAFGQGRTQLFVAERIMP